MSGPGRIVRRAAAGTPPPLPPGVALDPEMAKHFAGLGQRLCTPNEAVQIWNSAVMLGKEKAPFLAVAIGAGAVVAQTIEVVTRLCGEPPDPEHPFDQLPIWAVELFKATGVIPAPKPAVDPNAPPKPIESRQELAQRAQDAGLVLP